MPKLSALAALVAVPAALALATPAQAQPIESYNARLSQQDHFNSNGQRLTTVAAIVRQDRANYFRFGRGDPGDEPDRFFASAANRARLETLLDNASISRAAANAIINGTPMIHVEVWPRFVSVTVR